MILLGIDLETTGLDIKDRIIEIGAVLWDTDTHQPVQTFGALIEPCWLETEKPKTVEEITTIPFEVSREIEALTGITYEMLVKYGMNWFTAMYNLEAMATKADVFVAHNADFDKGFLASEFNRNDLTCPFLSKPWIDTAKDVPYPERIKTTRLTYLCAEHNFLNPFAHRAVTDVLAMLQVLSHYKIKDVLTLKAEPTLEVEALVSFDDNQKARQAGFYWNPRLKYWFKLFKKSRYNPAMFDFETEVLHETPGEEMS